MALLAALGAAAALAAMAFASRLPPGPEFLLPRRGGYALYAAAWRLFAAPHGRALFSALIAFVLLACAAAFAWALRRALPKKRPQGWIAKLGLAAGPVFAAFLAARAICHVLDLIALVWFPYGSMDVREPLAVSALGVLVFLPAAAASRAWVAGKRRRATTLLFALVALDVGGLLLASAKGVGRESGVSLGEGRTLYVVLTQTPRGPDREAYSLKPDVFGGSDPRPALLALASGPADARVLPSLRALYEQNEKRWDLDGLRAALLAGVNRGDMLAASMLLGHAGAAAPSIELRADLDALADEKRWRVGPLAAAELARAYRHQGDEAAAKAWFEKSGAAPGLIAADEDAPLKKSRISGTVKAPAPIRVALYRRADPDAPYLLDASGLVSSGEPDAKGRFSFSGMTAGRYYLAFALPAAEDRGEIQISGNHGDLLLTAKQPALALPPLALSFSKPRRESSTAVYPGRLSR
ncbi:MAG TPA: hypothetical protein VN915_07980 [Elusimicrobiota bacterium]|nr:hypothetical protein [Elusimicrobiota bacterium]